MGNENNEDVTQDEFMSVIKQKTVKELRYWTLYCVAIPFILPVFFAALGFFLPDKSFSDLFMPLINNNVYTFWALSVYISLFLELEYIPTNFMPRFFLFSTFCVCVIVGFFVASLIIDDNSFRIINLLAFILASSAIIAFSIQAKNKILFEINSKEKSQETKIKKNKRK